MFIALELSLEIVGELKDVRARVAQFDRGLEDEMRRAARSVALNVSEGSQRAGRDRPHAYRLAAGSAAELQTAMRIAIAEGYVGDCESLMAKIDREIRLLWGLTHPRGSGATASPSRDRGAPGSAAPPRS